MSKYLEPFYRSYGLKFDLSFSLRYGLSFEEMGSLVTRLLAMDLVLASDSELVAEERPILDKRVLVTDGVLYLSIPHLTGSETVEEWYGTVSEPTVAAGRVNLSSGNIGFLRLSDGTQCSFDDNTVNAHTAANTITVTNAVASYVIDNTIDPRADWVNLHGYTNDGGVIVPASTALNGKDAHGVSLQYGSAYPARMKPVDNACAVFDGLGGTYVSAPHLDGSEEVTAYSGDVVPSVSAGRIDAAAGWLGHVVLDTGETIHFNNAAAGAEVSSAGNVITYIGGVAQGVQDEYAADHELGFTKYTKAVSPDFHVVYHNGVPVANPTLPAGYVWASEHPANGSHNLGNYLLSSSITEGGDVPPAWQHLPSDYSPGEEVASPMFVRRVGRFAENRFKSFNLDGWGTSGGIDRAFQADGSVLLTKLSTGGSQRFLTDMDVSGMTSNKKVVDIEVEYVDHLRFKFGLYSGAWKVATGFEVLEGNISVSGSGLMAANFGGGSQAGDRARFRVAWDDGEDSLWLYPFDTGTGNLNKQLIIHSIRVYEGDLTTPIPDDPRNIGGAIVIDERTGYDRALGLATEPTPEELEIITEYTENED